jgi:hypothetical protein
MNDRLFTVVTIRTPDGQEMIAVPAIDVPLVHAAPELANAEEPVARRSLGAVREFPRKQPQPRACSGGCAILIWGHLRRVPNCFIITGMTGR